MAARKPSSPLAWVSSITAVFSLIAGIYAGWVFFSGQLEKRRAVARLLADEAMQIRAGDYQPAWRTLAQAAAVDADSTRVRQAQEDVAMLWLENISVSDGQTFASITEKLDPVLTRGAAAGNSPRRQADLLAHLGWSYFLRGRESSSSPDPEAAYRGALQKDPTNPYAHAMWGHWILWNHQDRAQAAAHFAAALAAGRPDLRGYIRSMQLSGLNNEDTPAAHMDMIRVANDIRKEHGDLEARWPHDILTVYWEYMIPANDDRAAFLRAVPPADHLATFDWLLQLGGPDSDALTHAYIRSNLLESAGRSAEALAGYRNVQSQFRPDSRNMLADRSRQAIGRLSGIK